MVLATTEASDDHEDAYRDETFPLGPSLDLSDQPYDEEGNQVWAYHSFVDLCQGGMVVAGHVVDLEL